MHKYQAFFEEAVHAEKYTANLSGAGPLQLATDLINSAYILLKKITHEEIDTPEERLAIVNSVMVVFDSIVNKLIVASPVAGIIATAARNTLAVWVTRAIEQAEIVLR